MLTDRCSRTDAHGPMLAADRGPPETQSPRTWQTSVVRAAPVDADVRKESSLIRIFELIHEHTEAVWWIAAISICVFLGSLFVVPFLVVRIPEDYFASTRRPRSRFGDTRPILRWTLWTFKNSIGALLILAGLAMLVLPGQGLLTIAVGLLMLDFPGKHRLERRLIQQPTVWQALNWLRRKSNRPPLKQPDDDAGSDS